MSIAIFVMSFAAGKLSTRIQPRYLLSLGFLSAIAGSAYLSITFNPYVTIINMVPGISSIGDWNGNSLPTFS